MEIRLAPYNSPARDPKTKKPLVNDDGSIVERRPVWRRICVDNVQVGYVMEDQRITFHKPLSELPEGTVEAVQSAVRAEFGQAGETNIIAEPSPDLASYTREDEDEDEDY